MKLDAFSRTARTARTAFAVTVLALAGLVGTGAALGAFSADAGLPEPSPAPEVSEQTVVTIRTADTGGPLEMNLDGLKEGESRTFKTSAGKDAVVTRTGDGYSVKIGDRTIPIQVSGGKAVKVQVHDSHAAHPHVATSSGNGGHKMVVLTENVSGVPCQEDAAAAGKKCIEKKIVLMTDGAPRTAKSLLEEARPATYEALDARTKESVEKVLQELLDKGALPGDFHFVTATADGAGSSSGGETVDVKVIRKKVETK